MTDLHAQIMNLPCKVPKGYAPGKADELVYRIGHRDARHQAAEIVAAHEACRTTRLDELESRLLYIALYGDRGNSDGMRLAIRAALAEKQ